MFFIAKLVAVLLIVLGCALMLRPEIVRQIVEYFKEGNRIYVLGVVRIVIGLILLNVSFQSRLTWIVFLVGILSIASGIFIFIMKKDKVLEIAEQMVPKDKKGLYPLGAVPVVIGVLLFFSL